MMMKQILTSILFLWVCMTSVQAGEIRRIGQDYRSLAMGNTGVVAASTSVALHYNPAALANIEGWWFNLPAVEVTFNNEGYVLVQNLLKGQVADASTYVGQSPYVKVKLGSNFLTNLSKRGFTVAANAEYEQILDFTVETSTSLEYYESKNTIKQLGFSYPFGLGQFVIGLSAKNVDRKILEYSTVGTDFVGTAPVFTETVSSTLPTLDTHGKGGIATGYDFGFMYRFASKNRWVVGAVYRGKLDFGANIPADPEEVAVGISTTRTFGSGFRFVGTLDIRDVTKLNPNAETSTSRTHLGFELGFGEISQTQSMFTGRAGFNQGIFTKGLEVALGTGLIVGYTEYFEDIGTTTKVESAKRMVGYLHLAF